MVLDSVVPPNGPEPSMLRPSRRSSRCSESSARQRPARASAATRWRHRRLLGQDAQAPLRASVVRRLRPHAHRTPWTRRTARHPRGRRPQPCAAGAAARGGAVRAARRPGAAAAAGPALGGFDPQRAARSPTRDNSQEEIDEALLRRRPPAKRTPFPWQRSAAPDDASARKRWRRSQRCRARPSILRRDHRRSTAGLMLECARLARRTPSAPRAGGALPDVPTLILSGDQDLRTPTSGRRRVAATIPGSQLLVVPTPATRCIGQRLQRLRRRPPSRLSSPARGAARARAAQNLFTPTPSHPRARAVQPVAWAARAARPHAHGGARHHARPRPPGDRRDAAGRARFRAARASAACVAATRAHKRPCGWIASRSCGCAS